MDAITLEHVTAFYAFLQGAAPPGPRYLIEDFTFPPADQPHLTPDQAYTVIYVLQEALGVLPDRFNQCACCKDLFDNHCSGYVLDEDFLTNENLTLRDPAYTNASVCDGCVDGLVREQEG